MDTIIRWRNLRWRPAGLAVALATVGLICAPMATAAQPLEGAPPEPLALPLEREVVEVLQKSYPRSVDDLRTIQQQVRRVLDRVMPATVGVQIGSSAGSGVIVSPDGLVLTAGHVSGKPNQNVVFLMSDGRRVRGRTLGLNHRIDSGMMKITDKGPWPYVPLAESSNVSPGQWVVATGHPGGYSEDRSPPVRLGRILFANDDVLCTDCTLVGGDSGGPLFNMQAEVVGIHSRIGDRSQTTSTCLSRPTVRRGTDCWRDKPGEANSGRTSVGRCDPIWACTSMEWETTFELPK